MTEHPLLDASCRVALAAYLHDLGKFAERAGAFDDDPRLDAHLQLYCPYHQEGRWFSHRHAANTALAFDLIEPWLPPIARGDVAPFRSTTDADESQTRPTDSLVNASAAHHLPQTFMQWIVATADRVASGFEREEFERYNAAREQTASGRNHFQARQLTLFEQIRRTAAGAASDLKWRYPLRPLSPAAIFPQEAAACEPGQDAEARAQYRALWEPFVAALPSIPTTHRANLPLWLDHFDTLWLTYTHAIPAATAFGVRPEVSLYDHSRTTAALAVALWRWHESQGATTQDAAAALARRADWDEPKLLLVQGDFFGIQDFLFAQGGSTQKAAAKLLRGRSFQVSLFVELAVLRLLDALGLPPTSVVTSAAGKFLLVAPNTPEAVATIQKVRESLDDWFEERSFGTAGIGIASLPASCNDFLRRHGERGAETPFARLMQRLFESLERAKHQRFSLVARGARVYETDFPHGVCAYHGRLPADRPRQGDEPASAALSRDQRRIGEALVEFDRALVVRESARGGLHASPDLRLLECAVFGYVVAFTRDSGVTGLFGALAGDGALRRCWDFSLPDGAGDGFAPQWAGCARRAINGYVPRMSAADVAQSDRYAGLIDPREVPAVGGIKLLDQLACEDREPVDGSSAAWRGVAALGVLKGDIDDLGALFQSGLEQPTFAKMAALSRQVNGFFAQWLPWLLAREYPSVYTVFAGGDDFFLIGPWRTVQKLAARMRTEFARYTAGNPELHFSCGIAVDKPGAPIAVLAEAAERALDRAKSQDGKDAITVFDVTVPWRRWGEIEDALVALDELRADQQVSGQFVYGLLQFVNMAAREARGDVESAIWRARLSYRVRRLIVERRRGLDETQRRQLQARIVADVAERGIGRAGEGYRISLFNHLYRLRRH